MSFIEVRNLTHTFTIKDENGKVISEKTALNHLDLTIEEGEFVVILGANGSGKTTLARHLNALLMPTDGCVLIDGKNTEDATELYTIRSTVGMVFQNPDNQLVAQILEDEVAFGPENLGLAMEEIQNRVEEALKLVGLSDRAHFPVEYLSGGQKQLAAIAGVLAMQPRCIVLDEATSMLDPVGRREILNAVEKLRCEKQIAIVMITHDVEESLLADQIFVMDRGRIVLAGKPEDIFVNEDQIRKYGLKLPQAAEIAGELRCKGVPIRPGIMTEKELKQELAHLSVTKCAGIHTDLIHSSSSADLEKRKYGKEIFVLNHITQRYFSGTDMQVVALKDVNFTVYAGEFVAVVGQSGSGKSTLLDLLGGITKPAEGTVKVSKLVNGTTTGRNKTDIITGIVFQYPDHQLFEETVLEDVMFGPKNMGMDTDQAKMHARQALQVVKLPEETWERSPLTLSGGEKRKAALAGVLAMEPEVLLLDEPTAGLAQADRTNLFHMLREEYHRKGKTVLFTTHHMEDVAEFAERVVVLQEGTVMFDGRPEDVFLHAEELGAIGLDVPLRIRLKEDIKNKKVVWA